jgi:hypothetical protein
MGTHIPKVYQLKPVFNRRLTAICPTQTDPAILSHRVPSQIGLMYNGWEAMLDDLNHHQHVGHNDHGLLTSTALVPRSAQQRACNRTDRRIRMLGNSLSLRSLRTPPKPRSLMATGMLWMTCDAVHPTHRLAPFPSALATLHPPQLREPDHKSSANRCHHLFLTRNQPYFQRLVHKLCHRSRYIATIRRRRPGDPWRIGGRWAMVGFQTRKRNHRCHRGRGQG